MKYLIILACLLTSCMTTKRIERHCDDFAKICIVETEKVEETTTETTTETTYGDTTVIVYIPEKKVRDKKPVIIIDEKKKPVPVKKKFVNSALSVLTVPFATSYAQVVNSRLEHELIQTDTLLLIELENALKEKKTLRVESTKSKEVRTILIKENNSFAKFTIKWFFGSLALGGILLTIIFFRFKSKILGLFK